MYLSMVTICVTFSSLVQRGIGPLSSTSAAVETVTLMLLWEFLLFLQDIHYESTAILSQEAGRDGVRVVHV